MISNTSKFQHWGSSVEQKKKLQEVTSLEHRESLETIRNTFLREEEVFRSVQHRKMFIFFLPRSDQ
jgi:hypothetical protein